MNIDLPLPSSHKKLFRVGSTVGLSLSVVETVFFGTQVNPIFAVALLLISAFVFSVLWGKVAWKASFYAWMIFQLVHLLKLVVGLTQAPAANPYLSVLMLGALTLVVTAFGTGIGNLFHKTLIRP